MAALLWVSRLFSGASAAIAYRALVSTQMGQLLLPNTELLAISEALKQNPNELMTTWIVQVYVLGPSSVLEFWGAGSAGHPNYPTRAFVKRCSPGTSVGSPC